jgi:hypothetical protein
MPCLVIKQGVVLGQQVYFVVFWIGMAQSHPVHNCPSQAMITIATGVRSE